jgi:hypothetical protein
MQALGKGPKTSAEVAAFVPAVEHSFEFLVSEFGFRQGKTQPSLVRYESPAAFLIVFYNKFDGELWVEIGRQVEIDGKQAQQKISLRDVMAFEHGPEGVGSHAFATRKVGPMVRFLAEYAAWTKRFASRALEGDPDFFEAVLDDRSRRAHTASEGVTAGRLRSAGDDAWRVKDWSGVVAAYGEMVEALTTVQLTPSERGRLKYAQDRTRGTEDHKS